jgi:curved DNA-binding protein CbpA
VSTSPLRLEGATDSLGYRSLISHPDRVPAGEGAEVRRKAATIEFQAVADAYYTLSDVCTNLLLLSQYVY